jgi:hypothetical protein
MIVPVPRVAGDDPVPDVDASSKLLQAALVKPHVLVAEEQQVVTRTGRSDMIPGDKADPGGDAGAG